MNSKICQFYKGYRMSLGKLRHVFAPRMRGILGARFESSIKFDASQDDVAEIIDRTLDKRPQKKVDDSHPQVLTTRREALSLYREIMRITALFDWPNETGRLWRDVLRESARKEFEASRFERDPETVTRMLVVGRDAVHQVAERFVKKREDVIKKTAPQPGSSRPLF